MATRTSKAARTARIGLTFGTESRRLNPRIGESGRRGWRRRVWQRLIKRSWRAEWSVALALTCPHIATAATPGPGVAPPVVAPVVNARVDMQAATLNSLASGGETDFDTGTITAAESMLDAGLRLAQAPGGAITPMEPARRESFGGDARPGRQDSNLTANLERVDRRPDSTQPQLRSSLFDAPDDSNAFSVAIGAHHVVDGQEGRLRQAEDVGSLLFGSSAANGIAAQQRNAVTYDVRIRGSGNSQNIGAGSYWNPGRPDLDTALNKIFSHNLDELIVVKGPYSIRYGPGFNFVEMNLERSPRYATPGWNGSTSINYETNGERWLGRQSLWGGGNDWGARVSYGHATGNDYEDGSGTLIPNSFKSRDVYATVGKDLSDTRTVEFSYIRLDQTDVEFPGLVFDIDFLVTDGFELEYQDRDSGFADQLDVELWYNRTRFEGDTLRPSKNRQIPSLRTTLFSPDGVSGYGETDVDGSSTGYRLEWSWFDCCAQWTIGTDMIYLDQTLNDFEPLLPPNDNNFPIPHSNSMDVGIFADYREAVRDDWTIQVGGRADMIQTTSSDYVPGVPTTISNLKLSPLDQSFTLWSAYATSDWQMNDIWSAFAGVGFSQRPPTLTEMYAEQAFIGTLQRGLTFVDGDPQLDPERLKQIDLGIRWNNGNLRGSLAGFYSWISDYITYDLTAPGDPGGGLTSGVAYVNTELATLAGFEFDSIYDVNRCLSLFGRVQFVEGRDRSRDEGSRLAPGPFRSGITGRDHEPLPGIAPLETRLGIRLHDPTPQQLWGTELSARVVDNQDRIAESLQEIATPGFTVWDFRSYWQLTDQVLLLTGVENITDKFYREHLDYRSGFGVYRRGANYYAGIDIHY